jgi:hypothetical protein
VGGSLIILARLVDFHDFYPHPRSNLVITKSPKGLPIP